MAKPPKWFHTTPTHLAHPGSTLKKAAKVVHAYAAQSREERNMDAYKCALFISRALNKVAAGRAWDDAFGFSQEQNNG